MRKMMVLIAPVEINLRLRNALQDKVEFVTWHPDGDNCHFTIRTDLLPAEIIQQVQEQFHRTVTVLPVMYRLEVNHWENRYSRYPSLDDWKRFVVLITDDEEDAVSQFDFLRNTLHCQVDIVLRDDHGHVIKTGVSGDSLLE